MGSLILGVGIGILLFFLVIWLIDAVTEYEAATLAKVIMLPLLIVMCATTTISIQKTKMSIGVDAYIITKHNIDNAIKNSSISDLEKINLIENITKYNTSLADAKRMVTKWYGFTYDKRVLDLDYIRIDNVEQPRGLND